MVMTTFANILEIKSIHYEAQKNLNLIEQNSNKNL